MSSSAPSPRACRRTRASSSRAVVLPYSSGWRCPSAFMLAPWTSKNFTPLARKRRAAHQALVDGAGALAALADRPDDQRLAAPHVAGSEQLGNRGLVVIDVGRDVAAPIERGAGLLQHAGFARPQEPHRQQDQVGLELEGAA